MPDPDPEVVSENMAHIVEDTSRGHVVDGVGICTRCGACSCCPDNERTLDMPCSGAV